MPNRIIKESITRSDQINALTAFEEVVFYRLIVAVDDYGCFDARPAIIKSALFPLKGDAELSNEAVMEAVDNLVRCGLVAYYEHKGNRYLRLPSWGTHQRLRRSKHKYPDPDADDCTDVLPEETEEDTTEDNTQDESAASCRELPQVAA